jgi:hypothetical protein
VSICGNTVRHERHQITCPVCHIADSWIVSSVSSSAWWGSINTCTNCGDSWGDGQLMARPFLRGWRQASIARAVEAWEQSCGCRTEWDDDFILKPCEHEQVAA